jgi:hypothetical protein
MDKADYLAWAKKYDNADGAKAQRERELGAKFRKNKQLSAADLAAVCDWFYKGEADKLARARELAARNSEEKTMRLTSQALSLPQADDMFRLNCLLSLEGITPVLASVVLAFYDPAHFGVFDAASWKALLGNVPPGLYTPQNYVRLLAALRKTAQKYNLNVRVVEKALAKKSQEESA